MLKSAVKDLFKKAGLEDFTVGRDSAGFLNIVGPCGKSIVSITNFPVGSKLSKMEREIAINEHIIPVLDMHSKSILDLIVKNKLKDDNYDVLVGFTKAQSIDGFIFESGTDGYMSTSKDRRYVLGKWDNEDNVFIIKDFFNIDEISVNVNTRSIADVKTSVKVLTKIEKVLLTLKDFVTEYDNSVVDFNEATDKLKIECAL